MRKKIIFIFLFASIACSSYFFAYDRIQNYTLQGDKSTNNEKKKNISTNALGKYFEKNLNEGMKHVDTLPFRDAIRLFLELRFNDEDMSQDYIISLALADHLVRDFSDQTMQFLFNDGKQSIDMPRKKSIYRSLACFYPEKIFEYPQLFSMPTWESISLIQAFFDELSASDPMLAEQYLNHDFFIKNVPSWDSSKTQFMLGFAKSKPEVLFRALAAATKKEDRFYILRALSDTYNLSNYQDGIEWAKKNLNTDQQRVFISGIAIKIAAQDWRVAFSIVNTSDHKLFSQTDNYYDGLSFWAFEDAIIQAAYEDPETAIAFVEKNYSGVFREESLSQILMILNSKYSSEQMLSIINLLPEGLCKTRITAPFFSKYYSEHPQEALNWLSASYGINESVFREFIWGDSSKEQVYALTNAFIKERRDLDSIFDSVSSYFAYNGGIQEGEAFAETLSAEDKSAFYSSFYNYTYYQYPEKTIISVQEKDIPEDLKNQVLANTFYSNINRGKIDEGSFSRIKTQSGMDNIVKQIMDGGLGNELDKIHPNKMTPEARIFYQNAVDKVKNK